jgi:hypothetical protein
VGASKEIDGNEVGAESFSAGSPGGRKILTTVRDVGAV